MSPKRNKKNPDNSCMSFTAVSLVPFSWCQPCLGCLCIKLLLWFKFIGTMKIYNLSFQTMKKAQLTEKSGLDILERVH